MSIVPMLLLSISLILTIAGFCSKFGWWFDLASHFRVQYFVLQFICAVWCLSKKRWKLLNAALIVALINLIFIFPIYLPPADHKIIKTGQFQDISILLINLNSSNDEHKKVAEYIQQINPDILALEEINGKWLSTLEIVLQGYPYREFLPREDNFGIGLYSKIASENMKIIYFGSVQVPSVLAKYSLNNKSVTLLFTHLVPPASLEYYHWRNEQLGDIASKRSFFEDNLILVGDLNATPWSYHFKDFIKKTGLIDTRQGFGLQITWPTMLPLMGIAIDHVLVSKNIKVLKRTVGPHIGSDHYPVHIKLRIN